MKSVVSEKGQVTIPKALRHRMGIAPGTLLDFQEEGGRLVAVKVGVEGALDRAFGILDLGATTDDIIIELRGPARDE